MLGLLVTACLAAGIYASGDAARCTKGDAAHCTKGDVLLQTKADYQPAASATDSGDGAAPPRNDHVAECLNHLRQHKDELRQAGFDIPQNGAHIQGDDPVGNPHGVVEGGATDLEFAYLLKIAGEAEGGTVCQTGFNYGTSALAFLCASPAQVYSFDLGEHNYVTKAHEVLNRRFGGRHHLTVGDSMATLRSAIAGKGPLEAGTKCDLVFVDGGHMEEVAKADLANFARLAAPGALVVVDDCFQAGDPPGLTGWHTEVGRAFRDSVATGLLSGEEAVSEGFDGYRSVCVGRYPGARRAAPEQGVGA